MLFSNQPEAAIASVEKAMEFSPHDPLLTYFYNVRGAANLSLGNFAAAIDDSRTSLRHSASSYWPYSLLAAALAASGEKAEAAKVVETLYEKFPAFTPVGAILDAAPLKPQAIIAAWQWWVHGLREAGIDIPEESLRFE
jgi:Flp pilus assembly protein TadD